MEKLKRKYRRNEQTILALNNNCVCMCWGGCPCGDPHGDDYDSFYRLSKEADGIINTGNFLPAN